MIFCSLALTLLTSVLSMVYANVDDVSKTDNTTVHFFLLMVPDYEVENLNTRLARQEEAAGGAIEALGLAEAIGPALGVGQILQGVLGGDLRTIFAGSISFIQDSDFRDGVTQVLQNAVAPAIEMIFREFNKSILMHFNATELSLLNTTTPNPNQYQQQLNNNQQNNFNQNQLGQNQYPNNNNQQANQFFPTNQQNYQNQFNPNQQGQYQSGNPNQNQNFQQYPGLQNQINNPQNFQPNYNQFQQNIRPQQPNFSNQFNPNLNQQNINQLQQQGPSNSNQLQQQQANLVRLQYILNQLNRGQTVNSANTPVQNDASKSIKSFQQSYK